MAHLHSRSAKGGVISPYLALLAGSVSSIGSNFILQPFDTVKTRMIAGGSVRSGSSTSVTQYGGMTTTFLRIFREESLAGLWKGSVPTMLRVGFGGGLHFLFLNYLIPTSKSNQSAASKDEYSKTQLGAAAAGARATASLIVFPLFVIKTRFEASRNAIEYRSVSHALSSIYRGEGPRGLYAGFIPSLVRDAPFSGIYVVIYTHLKGVLGSLFGVSAGVSSNAVHLASGLIAGCIASVVAQPADVVRTHMQLRRDEKRLGVIESIAALYKKDGLSGFLRGSFPRVMKRSVANAVTWTLYEQVVAWGR